MRVNTKLLIALSVVMTILIGFWFYDIGTNENFKAVTEVKLSLLFQRKTLDPPLFELVLEIPKSHFKVGEEIPVLLYLINKSNYPITIIHDVPFPLFLVYDERDHPIYGGLEYLLGRFPVLRPGQPYYGWDSRAPLPRTGNYGLYWLEVGGLKVARVNNGFRIIVSKPGVYTLKALAEFEILDMKRYTNLMSWFRDKRRVIEKKEILTPPSRVYVED